MSDIDWSELPSLSSLRSFEAAARLEGYSAAARSLNVTPAAVAQQVRALEDLVGAKLVRREGRGIVLTEAGRQLSAPVREAFALLASGVGDLRRAQVSRGIRATTTTFIVDAVILPKLSDFWRAHPDIQIAFVPGPCLVPVDFDGFDFGIRVGKPADWPEFNCDPLISCRKVFVAAPELAASAAPQDLPWILSEGPHDLRFLAEAGVDVSRIELRNIGGEIFEVEAAKRGVGAILATEVVVRQALADGALVELDLHHPEPSVYNVITPKEPVREPVRVFLDWLKEALGAPQV